MTWGNNSVFQLLIIQGSQAVTGLFLYNGLGAPGNPPQFAAVASGVTTDPFGNAIGTSKILIQGNVITESGGIFRTAAAAPLIQLDGPHDALWIYDSGAALIVSATPTAGNDGLGNTYLAGISEYVTLAGIRWAVTLAQSVAAFGGTLAGLAITNLTAPWSIPASVTGLETGGGANLELSSGLETAGGQQSAVILRDSVAGGTTGGLVVVNAGNFTAQTPVTGLGLNQGIKVLNDANGVAQCQVEYLVAIGQSTTPPAVAGNAVLFADTSGFLRMRSGLAGDTNSYFVARTQQQVNPRSQAISSLSFGNIGGLSIPVGIGTYFVRARLIIQWNAAAGTPQMQFAGPAVSQFDVSFKSQQSGSNSTTNNANTVSSAAGNGTGYNSGAINATVAQTVAGPFFDLDIWGMFTFTAAGTLTLQAETTASSLNTWIVFSGFWEVWPTL